MSSQSSRLVEPVSMPLTEQALRQHNLHKGSWRRTAYAYNGLTPGGPTGSVIPSDDLNLASETVSSPNNNTYGSNVEYPGSPLPPDALPEMLFDNAAESIVPWRIVAPKLPKHPAKPLTRKKLILLLVRSLLIALAFVAILAAILLPQLVQSEAKSNMGVGVSNNPNMLIAVEFNAAAYYKTLNVANATNSIYLYGVSWKSSNTSLTLDTLGFPGLCGVPINMRVAFFCAIGTLVLLLSNFCLTLLHWWYGRKYANLSQADRQELFERRVEMLKRLRGQDNQEKCCSVASFFPYGFRITPVSLIVPSLLVLPTSFALWGLVISARQLRFCGVAVTLSNLGFDYSYGFGCSIVNQVLVLVVALLSILWDTRQLITPEEAIDDKLLVSSALDIDRRRQEMERVQSPSSPRARRAITGF